MSQLPESRKSSDNQVVIFIRVAGINLYNAEIFLYKLWRLKCFYQFEITINVLVSCFRFV